MFTFGFYDSKDGDRKYNAEQMSSIFDGIIEDGVYSNVGEALMVVPGSGLQVVVKTGRAWFKHTWNLNDSWMPLAIDPPDVIRNRIDAVVIEVDKNVDARSNSIKVVKGTPATAAAKPTLKHEDGIDQFALAYVTIEPGVDSIAESKIEIAVGKNETPFIQCPLKTVSIEDLFNQWEGEFDEWFENVQATLTDNVVTNLQHQIDQRVKIADKATASDLENSVPNKWVDAAMVKSATNPLNLSDIGTVVESSDKDLAELYPDKFIPCNQQEVDVSNNPGLKKALDRRLPIPSNPLLLSSNTSVNYYKNSRTGCRSEKNYIGNRIFYVNGNSVNAPIYTMLGGATAATALQYKEGSYNNEFSATCYYVDEENSEIIACSSDNRVHIFDGTGKWKKTISHAGYQSLIVAIHKIIGKRYLLFGIPGNSSSSGSAIGIVLILDTSNGTIETTVWASNTNWPDQWYYPNNYSQSCWFDEIDGRAGSFFQEDSSHNIYVILFGETTSNGSYYPPSLWRSTNNGKTWSKYLRVSNTAYGSSNYSSSIPRFTIVNDIAYVYWWHLNTINGSDSIATLYTVNLSTKAVSQKDLDYIDYTSPKNPILYVMGINEKIAAISNYYLYNSNNIQQIYLLDFTTGETSYFFDNFSYYITNEPTLNISSPMFTDDFLIYWVASTGISYSTLASEYAVEKNRACDVVGIMTIDRKDPRNYMLIPIPFHFRNLPIISSMSSSNLDFNYSVQVTEDKWYLGFGVNATSVGAVAIVFSMDMKKRVAPFKPGAYLKISD